MGGGLIRLACYRTLGRLFTFELTIRTNHNLVDVGLYSLVRHPSYAGSLSIIMGVVLACVGPQSIIHQCGVFETSTTLRIIQFLWVAYSGYFGISLLRRVPVEEEDLRIQFGKEWEDYVARVPCRYIPGVV